MAGRPLRRTLLWLFLGFLGLTALLAIGAVLSGDLGPTQARILGTSGVISAASVCAMACAAFRERQRVRQLGDLGIALAGLAAAVSVVVLWGDFAGDDDAKAAAVVWIAAAAVAHTELLLLPPLAPGFRWVQGTVAVSIFALAALLMTAVLAEVGNDAFVRTCVVVSILVALQTLAVPLLWKLGNPRRAALPAASAEHLTLRRSAGGAWLDDAGNRYAVQQLPPGEPE